MTREALYVALTRGRLANHVHVATDADTRGGVDRFRTEPLPDAQAVLAGVLANNGQPVSVHQMITDLQTRAGSPAQIWNEYQTIAADAHRRRTPPTGTTATPTMFTSGATRQVFPGTARRRRPTRRIGAETARCYVAGHR